MNKENKRGLEERKKLCLELKKELEVHEVAEERHFNSDLIDSVKMQEDARHGMGEHHKMDKLIETLDDSDICSAHLVRSHRKTHRENVSSPVR